MNSGLYMRVPLHVKEEMKRIYSHGDLSRAVRKMLETCIASSRGDLETVQARLAVLEPEFVSLKARESELLAEKNRSEDERRTKETRIEEAHEKLLIELKDHHNRIEDVPKSVFKIYSEYCGVGIETLKAWLAEQAKLMEKY